MDTNLFVKFDPGPVPSSIPSPVPTESVRWIAITRQTGVAFDSPDLNARTTDLLYIYNVQNKGGLFTKSPWHSTLLYEKRSEEVFWLTRYKKKVVLELEYTPRPPLSKVLKPANKL